MTLNKELIGEQVTVLVLNNPIPVLVIDIKLDNTKAVIQFQQSGSLRIVNSPDIYENQNTAMKAIYVPGEWVEGKAFNQVKNEEPISQAA